MVKNSLVQLYFLSHAELSTSITIGLVVWYGGLRVIAEENSITLGSIFLFIQLTQMLFRPLRQIADKFNTLQMGMVAVQRVFAVMDTDSHIADEGDLEAKQLKGEISFQNVVFSYKDNEPVINDISFDVHALRPLRLWVLLVLENLPLSTYSVDSTTSIKG